MKKITILAILALLLLVTTLPTAAITWGEEEVEGIYPSVGIMVAFKGDEPVWRCSGVLNNGETYLTAGHCVGDGVTSVRVWFETDLNDIGYPDPDSGITGEPIPHPDYDMASPDPHDVGVVILDEFVDIEPETLPDPGLLSQLKKTGIFGGGNEEGVTFRSVGYGSTPTSWPTPVTEDFDYQRWVFESEFIALTKTKLLLSQRTYDGGDVWFGDSGGPVFFKQPDWATRKIVAVTGIGQTPALGNYRVDIPEILEWINDQISEAGD